VNVVLTSASKSTPPAEVDHDGMVASAVRDLASERLGPLAGGLPF
jgi:hypothetical protein